MINNQIVTTGIVLSRTDYNEADRIVTLLTPDQGKVSAIAKGVRRGRSKLAGGVELFSVSELTFLKGKSDLQTLISARLIVFYGDIVKDLARTQWAYEVLKAINRLTEEASDEVFFDLLRATLAALNDIPLALPVIELWFDLHLLRALGHQPNLQTDKAGKKLTAEAAYSFDLDAMSFFAKDGGEFTTAHIKLMRLAEGGDPHVIQQVTGIATLLPPVLNLAQTIRRNLLRY
jgi:DNA repair protein RecO (recombination protein O)